DAPAHRAVEAGVSDATPTIAPIALGSATGALPLVLDIIRGVTDAPSRQSLNELFRRHLRAILPADWLGGSLIDDDQLNVTFVDPPVALPSLRVHDYFGSIMLDN